MARTVDQLFQRVLDACDDAHLVAWDGCHKIYLAMDSQQAQWFRDDYPHVVHGSPDELFDAVVGWYAESCPLRFVDAVRSEPGTDADQYDDLIPQFADDDDD